MSADPFDDGRERLLSPDQQGAIQAWLRAAADLIGLRDWRITASPFTADRDCIATSHLRDHAEVSWVAVGRRFLESDPVEQAVTLTHELLHCHVQPLTRMAEELLGGELGRRTEAIIETSLSLVEERCIDRLAAGLAGLLPPFRLPGGARG